MTYLLIGDVDGGAVQMYYNLFEFTAPAISRLLLGIWICIRIIKRLQHVRPVLKNSLNLLGAGTDQNVGIYWSNHKPAISRLLLGIWICIGIIKRLRRVRPVLKNSLNLLGAGTDQNVGIYWSNHKPAISRLHESHAEFHTAGKLGDVKWRLAFRPLRSIVEECHEKMNHSNNDVRGLNDWLQLIYFTLAFSQ